MKVLIIGSKGYIGSNLMSELPNHGFEVTGYDMEDGQDIMDVPMLREAIKRVDAVINCAAISGIGACENNKIGAIRINVTAVGDIVQLSKEYRNQCILFSSFAVKAKPGEISFYGETKLLMEKTFKESAAILRLSNVYGGSNYLEKKSNNFLAHIAKDNPIKVYDPLAVRDFVHINRVMAICINILMSESKGVTEVNDGVMTSLATVANIVGLIRNVPVELGEITLW